MLTRLGDLFSLPTPASPATPPMSRGGVVELDDADMTNQKITVAPHWVIRRGDRYLTDAYRGRTVSTPYPYALNFCIKREAEDTAERMNASQAPEVEPWQVEPLDMAGLMADDRIVTYPIRTPEAA